MKRGETIGGVKYWTVYQPGELDKAIRELGTVQVLEMINAQLRYRGKARARSQGRQTTAKLLLKTG